MIGDLSLSTSGIQQLGSADAIAAFFARLGYQTNARTPQTPANLGITAEGTARPIGRIELIADHEGLQVYLFEVASVTLSHTRALSRTFRNRGGNYLLVLTSDYEYLDFVLLERYLASTSQDALGISTPQASIRPRVLTVERRNPSRVDLRVLRRFVYAASDGYGQYERLRAAYDIAEWSETFFNNRALFSDYYLSERLRDNPVWAEDPKPAFLRLREIFRAASSASGQPDEPLRRQIVEPTLEILGFRLRAGNRTGSETIEPNYLLSAGTEPDKTPAACLAYPWGRSLDGKDEQRDRESPEENPGAVVVSLLEKGKVPWVIVTNGKQWRLHAAKAHSRATNYYEVDLEEALAESAADGSDPAEAFRYFWLFFRRQAFEPIPVVRGGATHTLSFLDLVLADSEDYAKELGERLKNRVFIQTFPHLAEGFITFIRQRDGLHVDLSQDRLDEIYQGTLTLLYRLLFLGLYMDELPIRRIHFTTPPAQRKQMAQDLVDRYRAGEFATVLAEVGNLLPKDPDGSFLAFKPGSTGAEERSDVVHDLLTYLAQQMIMLNKGKQAELKRFLSWLESELRIALNDKASVGVEALTGKTILKNYLGDYQKGEAAAPLEALWRVLLENRRRIVRSLDPIFERAMRAEHEKSLSILLPIKTRLANTKWFIDQLVYRLYGLYEDEIAVVEGRR